MEEPQLDEALDDHEVSAVEESASAEEKLLTAGYRLLSSGTPLTALKLKALTREAGVSTGAFYHSWPSMLDYQRDLARHALQPANYSQYIFNMKAILDEVDPTTVPLDEVCRIYGAYDSAEMDTDQAFRAAISMWPLRDHPDVHGVEQALRESYREFAEIYVSMYQSLLDKYGFRLRPPFNVQLFAAALTALTEGLSLRRAVDPDVFALPPDFAEQGWEPLGLLIYALLGTLIVPSSSADPRSVIEFARDVINIEGSRDEGATSALAELQGRVELAEGWKSVQGELDKFREVLARLIDGGRETGV